jgi:hypothetical protein
VKFLDKEEKAHKKLRGCIAASPVVPFGFDEELTSSSLLSFSLPFYSPPNFLKFAPALLAERVFNLMYSNTELSCQEESDVQRKKNEVAGSESEKKPQRDSSSRSVESPLLVAKLVLRESGGAGIQFVLAMWTPACAGG